MTSAEPVPEPSKPSPRIVGPVHVGASALGGFTELQMCRRFIALKGKMSGGAIWCSKDGNLLPLEERLLLEYGIPGSKIFLEEKQQDPICEPESIADAFCPEVVLVSKEKKIFRGLRNKSMLKEQTVGDLNVFFLDKPDDLAKVRSIVSHWKEDDDMDTLLRSYVDRGHDWEEKLLLNLKAEAADTAALIGAGTADEANLKEAAQKAREQAEKVGRVFNKPLRCQLVASDKKDGRLSRDETLEVLQNLSWKREIDTVVLYQPALFATPCMYEGLGLNEEGNDIMFHENYPDFLFVYPPDEKNPKSRIVVVDAKAHDSIHAGHKIQVTFYVYMLEEMLKSYGLENRYQVDDEPGIWLRDMDKYTLFNSSLLRPVITSILSTEKELNAPFSIARVAELNIEDIPIVCSGCRYCQFQDFCRRLTSVLYPSSCASKLRRKSSYVNWEDRVSEDDGCGKDDEREEDIMVDEKHEEGAPMSLKSICGIHSSDIKLVESHLKEKGIKRLANLEETVAFLENYCAEAEKQKIDFSKEDDILQCVKAMYSGEVCVKQHGVRKFSVNGETICILLVLCYDKYNCSLLGFDIAVVQAKRSDNRLKQLFGDLLKFSTPNVTVEQTSTAPNTIHITGDNTPDVCDNLVKCLYKVLNEVDALNKSGKQYTLKMFTFTQSEAMVLFSILLRMASVSGEMTGSAISLLSTLFTDDNGLIHAGVVPLVEKADCGNFLCVLDGFIQDMFGLPLRSLEFSLSNCADVFDVDDCEEPVGYHSLSDFVGHIISEKKPLPWVEIRTYMKKSVSVLYQLLCQVRNRLESCPSVESEIFRWVPTYPPTISLLRRMMIFQIIQHMIHEKKRILDKFVEPFDSQLRSKVFFKVEYKPEKDKTAVFSFVDAVASKDTGQVDRWFLIPIHGAVKESFRSLTRKLIKQVTLPNMFWPEKWYRLPTLPEGWIITGSERTHEGDMTINLTCPKYLLEKLEKDRFFYLVPWKYESRDKRLLDFILSGFKYSVSPEELIDDPSIWKSAPFCSDMNVINNMALEFMMNPKASEFFGRLSKSQLYAMKNMISSHLTLLWGPPQTGTTTVLATLVAVFAKTLNILGGKQTMRVLFTAVQDSVIKHFLEEMKKKRDEFALASSQLAIGKMKWNGIIKSEGISRDSSKFFSDNHVCVVAGLIEQISIDEFTSDQLFEIVIWDETHLSYTKELCIPLKLLDRGRSRLIIAGDLARSNDHSHKFCATCIPVNDLVKPEFVFQVSNPPTVMKPVFDCLHEHLEATILSENWHWSDSLCTVIRDEFYPETLFHAKLLSGTHQVPPDFTFTSCPPGPLNGQIRDCCFGRGSGIAVVLFPWDKKPTFTDEHFEDDQVLEVYKALRSSVEMKNKTETEFWSQFFMIACVNHSQRDSISRKLKALDGLSESSPVAVDTIEHLHYMKRDVCLVDFAVFNSNKIEEDPNKFFNPQTLVTFLSRGKRCILFISVHVLTAWKADSVMSVEKWLQGLKILRDIVINADKQGCLFRIPPRQ